MTKDSRRSSAAGSAPPSHHDKDEDGDLGILPDAPAIDEPSPSLDADGAEAQPPESQPMTKTNSLDSPSPSLKESNGTGLEPPAAYGTRSRNRSGNARPNYAEDKELDADFEISAANHNISRKTARPTDMSNGTEAGQAHPMSHVAATYESDSLQNQLRESIPGTSSFSANPSTSSAGPASKKRKITGQTVATVPSVQAQVPPPAPQVPPPQAAIPKVSMTAQLVPGFRETNMLGFDTCRGRLKNRKLIADDGTILEVNDHVYLVCEPPGEPYYLGRIMEFLHVNNDSSQPIDALRLNWYYRPKDIGRKVNDTRQVFASMHSDISPLTALRGKCTIKHKSEVEKLDDLRRAKDSFWYEKLYDRYIHRFYDVVPTNQVINVPVEVKKVLDERWRYIIVEPGRGKELTSAVKSCKKCNKYCASNDSVDCAVCQNTYHMACVNPPLLKKPSRGFAWACGPCSKAQEEKLEARNTPSATDPAFDADEELNEEDLDSPDALGTPDETGRSTPMNSIEAEVSFNPGTAEQIHQASLWLFRYLGIHCKVEDALDYDDRIYPRASSRLGPRHQAIVLPWPGRPVEYVKPIEIKKKYMKGGGHKKDVKLSKETVAALEAEKVTRESRPKWVLDEPPGYTERGLDYDDDDERNTAKLLYRRPEAHEVSAVRADGSALDEAGREHLVFDYMRQVGQLAVPLGLPDKSTNLLDVALETLRSHGYKSEDALQALVEMDKKVFKEPDLTPAELKKFEDGVSKFGSEWHSIKKHVKTLKPKDVVRFYYTWKKTARGKQVWGNYSGRKNKKEAKRAEFTVGKLQDDVADEHDDSAFDNDKAFGKRRGFHCKFCATRSSRQWRRAPNTPAGTMIPENPAAKTTGKDKGPMLMIALCRRCAELWRRYAIQWEDVEEAKKAAQAGGRSSKRKIDDELLKELVAANEVVNHATHAPFTPVSAGGTPAPSVTLQLGAEFGKKKGKALVEAAEQDAATIPLGQMPIQKKKAIPVQPPPPPPVPEIPKPKTLPCAICGELEPLHDQHLTCKECRISVHRNCYGAVGELRGGGKWVCDMCSNDKNPQVSIQYKCMLCPVEHTEHDFVEPPRNTHKKKSEKDRERDRIERENNLKAADFYRKRQEEMNKPLNPREPLKRTANNNWVHVTCAVFTPEVKFGNAKALEPSEGIPSIASARYDETCKACKRKGGACVGCHSCRAPVHVECAHQAGYVLGFDITPVKGSRRDHITTVNINGEAGVMAAAVWCKEHAPTKTIVHKMHDMVGSTGLNALQLYVQNFKQADLTLTGTVRKATLVNQSTRAVSLVSVSQPSNRRVSTTNVNGSTHAGRSNAKVEESPRLDQESASDEKTCTTCNAHVSPRWWPFPYLVAEKSVAAPVVVSNGTNGEQTQDSNGEISQSSEQSTGIQVALAAAALHQTPLKVNCTPTEFQCHQCHWKKVKREPSPPPPLPQPPAQASSTAQQEIEAPHPSTATASTSHDPAADNPASSNPPSHYAWPQPPSYPSNSPYTWRRPSPAPQSTPIATMLNGNLSPQNNFGQNDVPPISHTIATSVPSINGQGINGQGHARQTSQSIPHSPHQNGHMPSNPNGYPPSPRRVSSSNLHMTNGGYSSYASPHTSTQHLINGGPPPRIPEHQPHNDYPSMTLPRHRPYAAGPTSPPVPRQHHPGLEMSPSRIAYGPARPDYPSLNPSRHPPSLGTAIGSPPLPGDPHQFQGRDQRRVYNGERQNGERQVDGQVNGGASASPSVRNLLS